MPDITSVRAKLAWARHHFKLVDDEIAAWLMSSPFQLVYHRNQQLTKHWFSVKIIGDKPDFVRWGLMIGDTVTNLRDTLDHLIVAIANLPTSPHPNKRDKAAFIIANTPDDFRKWSRSRLASVPERVRASVLTFQPFNRQTNSHLPSLLGVLSELANGSKHKLLTVVFTTPTNVDITFESNSGLKQQPTSYLRSGDIYDGTVVFLFRVPQPDSQMTLKPGGEISLHLAIKHKPLGGNVLFDADRTAYRVLLNALFEEVETVIDSLVRLV